MSYRKKYFASFTTNSIRIETLLLISKHCGDKVLKHASEISLMPLNSISAYCAETGHTIAIQ